METTNAFDKESFDLKACKALLSNAFILFDEGILTSMGREEVVRGDIEYWWSWNELQPVIQHHVFLFKHAQLLPLKNYQYLVDIYLALIQCFHKNYTQDIDCFYKLVVKQVIDEFLENSTFDIVQDELEKLLNRCQLSELDLLLLKQNKKGNWEFIDHSLFEYFLALIQYEEGKFDSYDYQFYLYYRFLKELYFKYNAESKISQIRGDVFLLFEEWKDISEQEVWRVQVSTSLRLYEGVEDNDLYGFRNVDHLQFIGNNKLMHIPILSELAHLQIVEFKNVQINSFTNLCDVIQLYKLYFENVKIINFSELIELSVKFDLVLEGEASWESLLQQECSTFQISNDRFKAREDLR
ncbi:hypothetical protein [uncultured Microscilla sp.]|uniref:hypothetical protein n=1 Tax=uncultured Microscilla sp. TaxID=432653 RepID=UPI0026133F17|nr:hypothetical protein [uncultured Microscilla sp.]